jgi:transcriptional regulator with XRE-family HTH domain
MTEPFTCPPEHKHGDTATCYTGHACRCGECGTAAVQRKTRLNKAKAFGRYTPTHTDPAPVREHALRLLESGYTEASLARAAGLHYSQIDELLHGTRRTDPRTPISKVLASNAEKILAVDFRNDHRLPHTIVPATGSARRIQALMVLGWSQAQIADRVGMPKQSISLIIRSDSVRWQTHEAIAALYEQMWNCTPPADTPHRKTHTARARNYAAARRWLPPMAWDDIDNDLTPPTPELDDNFIDEVLVDIAMAGEQVRMTILERESAIARLNRARLNDHQIAGLLHVNERTILRERQRLGITAAVGADKQPLAA